MISLKKILLILTALTALTHSEVVVRQGWGSQFILKGDRWYAPLDTYFDVSKFEYPVILNDFGLGYNQTQPYDILRIAANAPILGNTNWIKKVDDNRVIVCYNESTIAIQPLEAQGLDFEKNSSIIFTVPEEGAVCMDAAHYALRSYLYIGCVTRRTLNDKGNLIVFTYNLNKKEIVSTQVVPQDDGFRIQQRLQLSFFENQNTTYLAAYDLGNTTVKEVEGGFLPQVRLFRNLDIGKLKYYMKLDVANTSFSNVYNYFPYQGRVVAVGRLAAEPDFINLVSCGINVATQLLECDTFPKSTFVENGLFGVFGNKNQAYLIDTDKSTVQIIQLRGAFENPEFISEVIVTRNKAQLLSPQNNDGIFIRGFDGNTQTGVVNYWHPNFYDGATTVVSFLYGYTQTVDAYAGVHVRDSIIWSGNFRQGLYYTQYLDISRTKEPFIYVPTDLIQCPSGPNTIQKNLVNVEVRDFSNTKSGSISTDVYCVLSIVDGGLRIFNNVNEFVIKSGQQRRLKLGAADILRGNALMAEVKSEKGLISGTGDSVNLMNIKWEPEFEDDKVDTIAFHKQKALVHVEKGTVVFYNCLTNDNYGLDVDCKAFGTYTHDPGYSLPYKRMNTIGDLTFAYSCDLQNCFAVFAKDNGQVVSTGLGATPQILKDAFIAPDPNDPEFFLIVTSIQAPENNQIVFWRARIDNPEALEIFFVLSQNLGNSGIDFFCPTDIYIDPLKNNRFLALNDCGTGEEQVILKYFINARSVKYNARDALQVRQVKPFFCPMGNEHIIGSTAPLTGGESLGRRVYSISANDDLSFYQIPPELPGAADFTVSCISDISRFVIYGKNPVNGTKIVSVVIGNRGNNQLARYPVARHVTGGAKKAQAYRGEFGIVHWVTALDENNKIYNKFYLSNDAPVLTLTAKTVTETTTDTVEITLFNVKSKATFNVSAEVILDNQVVE